MNTAFYLNIVVIYNWGTINIFPKRKKVILKQNLHCKYRNPCLLLTSVVLGQWTVPPPGLLAPRALEAATKSVTQPFRMVTLQICFWFRHRGPVTVTPCRVKVTSLASHSYGPPWIWIVLNDTLLFCLREYCIKISRPVSLVATGSFQCWPQDHKWFRRWPAYRKPLKDWQRGNNWASCPGAPANCNTAHGSFPRTPELTKN